MDGNGRALDNVMIERLWRTVKYDDIYVRGYKTMN
jgi:putative transposase